MAISLQEKKIEKAVERGVLKALQKAFLDRELNEALDEIRMGQAYGPFKTAQEGVRFLHRKAKELKNK